MNEQIGEVFNWILLFEKGFCEERSDEANFQKQPECKIDRLI